MPKAKACPAERGISEAISLIDSESHSIENNISGQKRRRISMKDGIQQTIEKYTNVGKLQGIEQGISIFITDKVDDGVDYDTIKERLITRFTLTPDSADSYTKKYAVKTTEKS